MLVVGGALPLGFLPLVLTLASACVCGGLDGAEVGVAGRFSPAVPSPALVGSSLALLETLDASASLLSGSCVVVSRSAACGSFLTWQCGGSLAVLLRRRCRGVLVLLGWGRCSPLSRLVVLVSGCVGCSCQTPSLLCRALVRPCGGPWSSRGAASFLARLLRCR